VPISELKQHHHNAITVGVSAKAACLAKGLHGSRRRCHAGVVVGVQAGNCMQLDNTIKYSATKVRWNGVILVQKMLH
jgi:hypothetical protein